jgi:hypothetical protein
MSQKLVCFLILTVLFVGVSRTSADLVGYWPLDGDGADAGGNGLDGTLNGTVVPTSNRSGSPDSAMQFGGGPEDYVEIGDQPELQFTGAITLSAWVMLDSSNTNNGRIVSKIGGPNARSWSLNIEAASGGVANPAAFMISATGAEITNVVSPEPLPTDEWVHMAGVYQPDEALEVYVNGDLMARNTSNIPASQFSANGIPVRIGNFPTYNNCGWLGSIDEVRIYDHAMSLGEIRSIMAGVPQPYAYRPTPGDGAVYVSTWVMLSWKSGDFAVSHDVYLGDNLSEVEQATRDSAFFRGNQTTDFYLAGFPGNAYPEGLVGGTTYYWRIDEVNDANPESPWKGLIWSFSIPPKTAYNPVPVDGDAVSGTTPTLSWTAGLGATIHTFYLGEDYEQVQNATQGGIVLSTTNYSPGQLEGEKVYYWRVDEGFGADMYEGDVWTFTTPGAVGDPQPANSATDVAMATVLSWTAADNAASHQVYLGTDKDAVRSADTSSPEYVGSKTLGDESHDPGFLEGNTAYYWRVDEVYNGSPLKGPVWTFTVSDYLLVDDFESYTDDDPNNEAIWQHWIDGFGVADNGSQVGYLTPPYAEQTIVHGGSQSMPLLYANEGIVSNSEAVLTLTTLRDWTVGGVGELSLWIRGASGNAAEPLYVAISNSAGSPAVVAHEDSDAVTGGTWSQWRISLSAFADQGINLSNVDKIAIGLGSKSGMASAGGSGTMFVDDIRLYRQ